MCNIIHKDIIVWNITNSLSSVSLTLKLKSCAVEVGTIKQFKMFQSEWFTMTEEKNLISIVKGEKSAIALVKRHYGEIETLIEQGYQLKQVYDGLSKIYKDDISGGTLKFSLQNFYRIYKKLKKENFTPIETKTENGISEEVKPGKTSDKRSKNWNNQTDGKHPFVDE